MTKDTPRRSLRFATFTAATALAIFTSSCQTTQVAPSAGQVEAEIHPADSLAKLDKRQSLPLQPMMANHQKQNMREHLEAVQRIIQGLATSDWKGIEKAATELGTSPKMVHMCEMMGSGAPGFSAMGLDFHKRADAITAAAAKHDATAVLEATSHALLSCTACHTVYRQDVVSRDVWQERTGKNHDPAAMHRK